MDNFNGKLTKEEIEMVNKGKKNWSMDEVKKKFDGGFITNETLTLLIDSIIENTWSNAKMFYNKNK